MTDQDVNEALSKEYGEMREEFDIGYVVVGLALVLIILYFTGVIGGSN